MGEDGEGTEAECAEASLCNCTVSPMHSHEFARIEKDQHPLN